MATLGRIYHFDSNSSIILLLPEDELVTLNKKKTRNCSKNISHFCMWHPFDMLMVSFFKCSYVKNAYLFLSHSKRTFLCIKLKESAWNLILRLKHTPSRLFQHRDNSVRKKVAGACVMHQKVKKRWKLFNTKKNFMFFFFVFDVNLPKILLLNISNAAFEKELQHSKN